MYKRPKSKANKKQIETLQALVKWLKHLNEELVYLKETLDRQKESDVAAQPPQEPAPNNVIQFPKQ
jgi:hypothetical protein